MRQRGGCLGAVGEQGREAVLVEDRHAELGGLVGLGAGVVADQLGEARHQLAGLGLAFDRQQDDLEYRNAEAMSIYEGKGLVVRLVPGQTEQVRVPLISTKE